jgi:hypothetical protein
MLKICFTIWVRCEVFGILAAVAAWECYYVGLLHSDPGYRATYIVIVWFCLALLPLIMTAIGAVMWSKE